MYICLQVYVFIFNLYSGSNVADSMFVMGFRLLELQPKVVNILVLKYTKVQIRCGGGFCDSISVEY